MQNNANRLIHESSPYLRQHARNPVDWHPWDEEAQATARREDKPIFLSIGYSACHWCHVMAHECFENAEIAALMNRLFVNIKVDREERPDIDTVYMQALTALAGHGGWPMSLFLTPDLQPYSGGTYFPPSPKNGRPGFPQILQQAHDLYKNRRDRVGAMSQAIMERMAAGAKREVSRDVPDFAPIRRSAEILAERYDDARGGFGMGMKFPEPSIYALLLRHWLRTGDSRVMEMLDKSLTRMAEGGMCDHLGGGFHRYSTDRDWKIPHFEKMLYDNALLARLYLEMFQATKQEIYRTVPRDVFAYVLREMTADEGCFYSSQDADSDGKEGAFYVWELKEILDILGPKPAKVFARAYGVASAGNFEGRRSVLRVSDSLEKISESENIPIFEVHHIVKTGLRLLFQAREKRAKPGRDDKAIASWNGLMITALATGYAVLREKTYLDAAARCADFIWSAMRKDGELLRVYRDGQTKIPGFLEDYACYLESHLALYEATFDAKWIERAEILANAMIERFWDTQAGGFFILGKNHEKLIHQPKNPHDEAIPSANAIATMALLKLGRLMGRNEYWKKGEDALRAFGGDIEAHPAACNGLLAALDFYLASPTEMVFAGDPSAPDFEEMYRVSQQDYRPNKILAHRAGAESERLLPMTQGRPAVAGNPTVYLCQKQTCHPPASSGKILENLLERPPIIRLNLFDEEKKTAEMRAGQNQNFLNAMSRIFKHTGFGKR